MLGGAGVNNVVWGEAGVYVSPERWLIATVVVSWRLKGMPSRCVVHHVVVRVSSAVVRGVEEDVGVRVKGFMIVVSSSSLSSSFS